MWPRSNLVLCFFQNRPGSDSRLPDSRQLSLCCQWMMCPCTFSPTKEAYRSCWCHFRSDTRTMKCKCILPMLYVICSVLEPVICLIVSNFTSIGRKTEERNCWLALKPWGQCWALQFSKEWAEIPLAFSHKNLNCDKRYAALACLDVFCSLYSCTDEDNACIRTFTRIALPIVVRNINQMVIWSSNPKPGSHPRTLEDRVSVFLRQMT